MSLFGTIFFVGFLSKYLKIADIILTLISTFLTIVSRIIYSFVRETIWFFFGTAVDFAFSVKLLAVKSIISKLVPSEDLSTMFAIMGLFEALSSLIFSYIYPTFYQFLLSDKTHDVSDMFILSATLCTIGFITYS